MRSAYLDHRLALKLGTVLPKVKEKKPIPKVSEKRKKEQKEYKKMVADMAKDSDRCEVRAEGCQNKMTGAHHKQKRSPKNFLKLKNLLRACDNCQLWIELHPKKAAEKGFTISRSKKIA